MLQDSSWVGGSGALDILSTIFLSHQKASANGGNLRKRWSSEPGTAFGGVGDYRRPPSVKDAKRAVPDQKRDTR